MKFNMTVKAKRIVIAIAGLAGLSTLSFNCAPSLFKPVYESSGMVESSSLLPTDTFSAPKSPYALLTHNQVFRTMANVTGQELQISAAQRNEFNARAGSLSEVPALTSVNAPLQMAVTSLAGEMCNGLITRETAAGATRKYFTTVDFGQPIASNQAAFNDAIANLARGFWGRNLNAEELSILQSFATDFAADPNSAGNAGTRRLMLATCSAMLASFDALIY